VAGDLLLLAVSTNHHHNSHTRTKSNVISAVADMPPKCLYECIRQRPPRDCENNVSPTFDALVRGISSSYIGFVFGMRKLEWLGYNLVKVACRLSTIHQRDT